MESHVLSRATSFAGGISSLRKLHRETTSNNSHIAFVQTRPIAEGANLIWEDNYGRLYFSTPLDAESSIGQTGDASAYLCGGLLFSRRRQRFRWVREAKVAPVGFFEKYPALVTGFFFFMWYFLNVIFNILNKKIYNYFPYPYFVSVIHLLVGVVYCLISWAVGLPKRAPIDSTLLKLLIPVAFCHALGHVTSNVSFAAVAVSFTHTVKALEPFFNAAASQFILGQSIPITLWLSLAPVVIGVSMASLTELSFNWTGFISAMISNISFTYRSLYSKKAMTDMDSTNVYAYISIIALLFCIPPAVIVEGPQLLKFGFNDAIAKGWSCNQIRVRSLLGRDVLSPLQSVSNQNTLERVAPLTHAVGNVAETCNKNFNPDWYWNQHRDCRSGALTRTSRLRWKKEKRVSSIYIAYLLLLLSPLYKTSFLLWTANKGGLKQQQLGDEGWDLV
ncbi:hypothetical protein SDJN03_21330, partial [Cucurbita argyrosperma subsp. sororia]